MEALRLWSSKGTLITLLTFFIWFGQISSPAVVFPEGNHHNVLFLSFFFYSPPQLFLDNFTTWLFNFFQRYWVFKPVSFSDLLYKSEHYLFGISVISSKQCKKEQRFLAWFYSCKARTDTYQSIFLFLYI